ncbi:FAD-dependent oxidoreductase, partial [Enterococcus cecorum]|uniref:FAD-dependent oxidoreductase n=1 Tax=Enterococcus cecorum TaxID=44008 RepID=UPI001AD7FAA1
TEALGLEKTDIQVDTRGAIQTDEFLQTAVENVWALGDVRGDLQFTYISLDDFRIVYNQLFQDKYRSVNNRPNVPYTMFIQPAFSHVGLHEKEAQAKKMKYRKFTYLNSNVPKANILENPVGMWQILVDEETDQVLGATIFGEESYEVINLITLAMNAHLPYQMLRDQIYTHPTMSEALNDVLK